MRMCMGSRSSLLMRCLIKRRVKNWLLEVLCMACRICTRKWASRESYCFLRFRLASKQGCRLNHSCWRNARPDSPILGMTVVIVTRISLSRIRSPISSFVMLLQMKIKQICCRLFKCSVVDITTTRNASLRSNSKDRSTSNGSSSQKIKSSKPLQQIRSHETSSVHCARNMRLNFELNIRTE